MALLPSVHFEQGFDSKNGAVCFYNLPLDKQLLIAEKSLRTLSRVETLAYIRIGGGFAKNYQLLARTAFKAVLHIEKTSEEASLMLRKRLVEGSLSEEETECVLTTFHSTLEHLFFEHHGFFLDFRTPDEYHLLMQKLTAQR